MNPTSEPTPEEVIRQLREIDPSRSYCVVVATWGYDHRQNTSAPNIYIRILPGLDETPCSHHPGSSLTGALENAKAGLREAMEGQIEAQRAEALGDER